MLAVFKSLLLNANMPLAFTWKRDIPILHKSTVVFEVFDIYMLFT